MTRRISPYDYGGRLATAYRAVKFKAPHEKFRPIFSTCGEPSYSLSNLVSRGLDLIISAVPQKHFDLRNVGGLVDCLQDLSNTIFHQFGQDAQLLTSSGDIKDMFLKLNHNTASRCVRQCVTWVSEVKRQR